MRKLLTRLLRYAQGEPQVWHVVHVPSVAVEEQRHLHRDLETLQRERTRTSHRSKGLLSTQGVRLVSVHQLPEQLEALRLGDGSPVPPGLRRRLRRVSTHYTVLGQQLAEWAAERRASVRASQEAHIEQVRQLMHRKGVGMNGAWLFVMECFGWRDWQNRRQVGS